MKLLLLLITVSVIIAVACNKDKFTTIPQLQIKSISPDSPDSLQSGRILTIKGSYTDREGDIDTIFVVRKFFTGNTVTGTDTIEKFPFSRLNVPPKTIEANIQLTFEYNTQNTNHRFLSGVPRDTTAAFGIILKDKAANRSEYKESKKIRIKKP